MNIAALLAAVLAVMLSAPDRSASPSLAAADEARGEKATASRRLPTIDFSIDEGPATHRASGVFQISGPPLELVTPLKIRLVSHRPKLEVVERGVVHDDYGRAKQVGAAFQLKLGGGIAQFTKDNPWPGDHDHWAPWLDSARGKVQMVQQRKAEVEYDIANEPDSEWNPMARWNAGKGRSYAQYLEMWQRTYRLIREQHPDAPITGPSSAFFPFVRDVFLPFVTERNVVPDVLSWHSYDGERYKPPRKGAGLVAEVAEVRKYFQDRNRKVPRISINEYVDQVDMMNAAAFVKHFYELERAKVDSAARGCWNENPRGQTAHPYICNFNNLLTADHKPRANWWALKGYADVTGRLVRFTPGEGIYGVAGYDAAKGEARVVLGNIGEAQDATVEFLNVDRALGPTSTVHVEAQRVPASDRAPSSPVTTLSRDYQSTNKTLSVTLPRFGHADVYTVVVRRRGDGVGPERR